MSTHVNRSISVGTRHSRNDVFYPTPHPPPPHNVVPWVRNPSWLTLPTVLSTDEKFVGLVAVQSSDNFVAVTCAGNYTVNWGDGSAPENFASGVKAEHTYDYNDVDLANTDAPVTFTALTSTVNRVNHGYTNGMPVRFYEIVTTTGIVEGISYYVINATPDSFQLSTNGDPTGLITLTGNGSAVLLQHKQAIVTITPQLGQSLTSVDLQVRHSIMGTYVAGSHWVDIALSLPNCGISGLKIGATALAEVITHLLLEQVTIKHTGSLTSGSALFAGCRNLKSVPLFDTAAFTTMDYMFSLCQSIHEVPWLNTSNVTNMQNMFAGCRNLRSIPVFNTPNVTNMSFTFSDCQSLHTIPLLNTSNVTTLEEAFSYCYNLNRLPLFDTSKVSNMNRMVLACYSLRTLPLFNTALVTDFTYMFADCYQLDTVPQINTSSATTMFGMFYRCYNLQTIPLLNTSFVTDTNSMFAHCYSLREVPLLNLSSVTATYYMFQQCYSLETIPEFNLSSLVDGDAMFIFCTSLKTVPGFSLPSATLLGSFFGECNSLEEIPYVIAPVATDVGGMFGGCESLKHIPHLHIPMATNLSGLFQDCHALERVPKLDTSNATVITHMFAGCISLTEVPTMTVSNAVTSMGNFIYNCKSLDRVGASSFNGQTYMPNTKLSKAALEDVFMRLKSYNVFTSNLSVYITGSYGADPVITKTGNLTTGSTTITMTDTSSLAVGMQVLGSGTPTTGTTGATPIIGTSTLQLGTTSGLNVNDMVSFNTTASGVDMNTIYYVRSILNATNIEISATLGGAAIVFTGSTGLNMRVGTYVTAIDPNVSVTITRPAVFTQLSTLSFRMLKTNIAILKGYSVTG